MLREPDLVIVQASANAAAFLGLPGDPLGRRLTALPGNLAAIIQPHLAEPLDTLPIAVRCRIGDARTPFDGLLHRPPATNGRAPGLVIELEAAVAVRDPSKAVERGLKAILSAHTMAGLCDDAARIFRDLTGYDRVMVYRFDQAGHGQVIAEERQPALEALLGNRYPASDIPHIARQLYIRNRVRVLADINYTPVPLAPVLSPDTGQPLDMSLCCLRSISPIHVQYLKNMGVRATLVASIVVGNRLWGLVSCHHYAARLVPCDIRSVCELLAEALGTRIAALESFAQGQAGVTVRRLEKRMIAAISRNGDWRGALFDSSQAILRPLHASGAALLLEGEVQTTGDVPGTQQLRSIAAWLDRRSPAPLTATASLGLDVPDFATLAPVASGIVAVRLSDAPGDYLMWFRPEQVRTLTWGGNPHKAVVIGTDPRDLSPRRSFAQWHQTVEGTSEPWSEADITAARLICDTVTDVVLQFRAVRTLVAQDQLDQVRRQVGQSDQPVLIADEHGYVILANDALKQMLPTQHPTLHQITDLPHCCIDPDGIRTHLAAMLTQQTSWRGEIILKIGQQERLPVLLRADPVFSSPNRILGFVLLFTDLTERKAGDAARRHFQDSVFPRHKAVSRLETRPDLLFQTLLSTIVENAQLAALEITDGVELSRMPDMLQSIRASVQRASTVLEHLIRHSSGTPEPED